MNRFVFVVPYYNEINDIEKTLFSMLSQSYGNWRAILINDLSTDGSDRVVRNTVNSLSTKGKFTLVDTHEKHGEVRNTLIALERIDDDEIVCRLDGGDWLVENDLLWLLNEAYKDKDLAVAWTSHRWGYTNQNISGPMTLQKDQTVYQHPWVSSHLKTFKAERLRVVPKKNFFTDDGEWIMIACDQAIFLPMMHKSLLDSKRLLYVPIVGYHYNINLADKQLFTSTRALNQKVSAETIRKRGFVE